MNRVVVALSALELARALEHELEHPAVHPDAVRRIPGIFLALQPVAIEHVDRDLADAVGPDVEVPARQGRRRQRPHVCKDEPAQFLDGIALELPRDLAFGMGFQRPLETRARRPEKPAVIRAAQTALVGNAELKIDAAMQAAVPDEPQMVAAIAVEHEILAENTNL